MADLITIDDYKEIKGIQSEKEDLKLEALVASVSQLVKTYCGNSIVDFYSFHKTEFIDITYQTHVITLTETPVRTITSVEERSGYSSAYTALTTASYEYYLNTENDCLYRTTSTAPYKNWPLGPGAVKVVYTAGYESTPEDLKLAVYDLITYYLKDEYKQRQTLSGATRENSSTTSMTNSPAFPDHIKRVLDLYKNI